MNGKLNLDIKHTPSGVSIWAIEDDGLRHWVLDASTILESGNVTIATGKLWPIRFEKITSDFSGHTVYSLKGLPTKNCNCKCSCKSELNYDD